MVWLTEMYQLKRQCIEGIWFYAQLVLQVEYHFHGPWFTRPHALAHLQSNVLLTENVRTQKNSQFILQFSEFTTWWVVSDEGVDLPFYFHHSQLITWRVVTKIVDYFMSLVTDEWMHYPTISICFIKGFVGPKRLFFFFKNKWIIVLDTMF